MEFKELGKTGVMLPEVGLGTWLYEGGEEPLRTGIRSGANHIDTAEMYGTEGIVGRAVQDIRDQVFIGTKMLSNHLRHDDVLRAAEDSLNRLNTSWIDLYQIHFPNPRIPIKETMNALEQLVDEKVVRYLGVSNFSLDELDEARGAMRNHPLVANQVMYNLNKRDIETELIPYCERYDITIVAHTPLADGSIASNQTSDLSIGSQVLRQVATEVGRTAAQVALAWCISHTNVITIPKSNTERRIVENCFASGWKLTKDQLRRLNDAFPRH